MTSLYAGAAPTITGAGNLTSVANGAVDPFTGVTITDPNYDGDDTLVITLTGIGGTFAPVAGLTYVNATTYTLHGSAAQLTSELDSLVFTPTAQTQNTSNTAGFTLALSSSAYTQTTFTTPVTPTTLASFPNGGPDGYNPAAALYSDANGNLFGTLENGANGFGGVFEIQNTGTPHAPSYTTAPVMIHAFTGGTTDGAGPVSGLIADGQGDLFGTTEAGGAFGDGAVYELVKSGSSYSERLIASFNGADGNQPVASLVMDAKGDLFGTTQIGGANNLGAIFEIVNNGTASSPSYASTPTLLGSFTGGADGSNPLGGLVIDGAGNLIGTTSTGGTGAFPDGAVFELVNNGTASAPSYASSPTGLVEFNGTGAATDSEHGAAAALVKDAAGDLFGTSPAGGSAGLGTVFEIVNTGTASAPIYSTPTVVLYSFTAGSDGSSPEGGLSIDAAGDLFGTTTQQGANGVGTAFELALSGSTYTFNLLATFNDTNTPYDGVIVGAGGNLYGSLSYGPNTPGGSGSIFEISGVTTATQVTNTSASVTDKVPAVTTITGSHATIKSGSTVNPFTGVTIGDINSGSPNETLTITLSGVAGTLSGTGLSGSGSHYTLTGSASTVTSELDALVFTPTGAISGSAETTFTLSNLSSTPGSQATVDAATIALLNATVVQTDGSTDLILNGNNYYLLAHGTATGPELTYNGAAVTTGEFGAWTPIGAVATGGGYDVAWKNTSTGQFTVWTVNSSGAYVSSPFGAVAASSPALEALESTFGQDLNGDSHTGLNGVSAIQTDGSTELASSTIGSVTNYYLLASGGDSGPELSFNGVAVTSGQFAGWSPIGAVATSSGYDVAWHNASTSQYTVWTVDGTGAYSGSLFGAVMGNSYALESAETLFGQDLNGDGSTGVTPAAVVASGSNYLLGTGGPQLSFNGLPVTSGQFGAWAPLDALPTSSGYDVVWHNTTTGDFTVWAVSASGAYSGSLFGDVAATSYALETFETTIGINLNGDGATGVTPAAVVTSGSNYLLGTGGPQLSYNGSPVTSGQFGAWTPLDILPTSSGYDVVWHNTTTGDFTVWATNSSGAFTGNVLGDVSATSYALESFEGAIGIDLNSDGVTGVAAAAVVTSGSNYKLGTGGPLLNFNGSAVTSGQFSGWTPLDEVATSTGFEVAFKQSGTNDLTFWDVDANGNFVSDLYGALSPTSIGAETLESLFNMDLNSDGVIGLNISGAVSTGTTTVAQTSAGYKLGASGPILSFNGSPVTAGEFGAWSLLGAEALNGGGYEVSWRLAGTDEVTAWKVSSTGAYSSSIVGALHASSAA